MSEEKLARMANQIAVFFKPYPEAEAVKAVRDHIKAFWTTAMAERLRADLRAGEAQGLDPLVVAALSAKSE